MNSRSKYHNRRIERDGQTFDSVKEYRRWNELRIMERAGLIQDLKRQVQFELIPSQKEDGKVVERAVVYKADFAYMQDSKYIVEDTKGYKTQEYILKRKMMLYVHGIRVKET